MHIKTLTLLWCRSSTNCNKAVHRPAVVERSLSVENNLEPALCGKDGRELAGSKHLRWLPRRAELLATQKEVLVCNHSAGRYGVRQKVEDAPAQEAYYKYELRSMLTEPVRVALSVLSERPHDSDDVASWRCIVGVDALCKQTTAGNKAFRALDGGHGPASSCQECSVSSAAGANVERCSRRTEHWQRAHQKRRWAPEAS